MSQNLTENQAKKVLKCAKSCWKINVTLALFAKLWLMIKLKIERIANFHYFIFFCIQIINNKNE